MANKPIYLDCNATTPVDPRVFEAMRPYFMDVFGNPGSSTHEYGDKAHEAVENARIILAEILHATHSSEIVFTSGATEANNIALQGIVRYLRDQNKTHVVTSRIEHKSILDVCRHLEGLQFQINYLTPNPDGTLNLSDLQEAITTHTGLISIMHANNEIGVINPVAEIGEIARSKGVLFHCDAAQSFGKIPLNVQAMNIDLLSVSAHKIYGPKGSGALYIRKGFPAIKLEPLFYGGGQEQGLRSGTLAPALIVGLSEAAKICAEIMSDESQRLAELRNYLLKQLTEKCPDVVVNGTMKSRLPHNLNISFLGVPSDTLMMNLRNEIAVSNGSACTSYAPMPSYVLRAIGIEGDRANSAIRFGLGRFTTKEEIDCAASSIIANVDALRGMLPRA